MVDIIKVEKLMQLMAKHGIDVLQAESSGEKFSLAKNASQTHFFQAPRGGGSQTTNSQLSSIPTPVNLNSAENVGAENSAVSPPVQSALKEERTLPAGETITSPFVGTFYRAANPDTPAFVEVGSKIKKGQSLCIVEAMKLMNEIESEVEGEVVAILVENAKPVEFGTPLFVIAPIK